MSALLRTVWMRLWLTFSIGLMTVTASAQSLEVIELKHRSAQDIIPTLQPLLTPGGALSGQDYTLFVRTSSANLAEIRRVVAQLDRAQRQLRVSVRTATRQQIERESAAVAGELSTRGGSVSVRGSDASAQSDRGDVASVAVLEGSAAMIDNGSSVPVISAVVIGGGRRPELGARTEYRDLPNGFLVTPRVSGETVVLDIQQRRDTASGGRIDTQQVQTQVSGRLGDWISLGGTNETSTTSQRGLGSRQYSTRTDERSVWIKVEAP